jgi:hypothetical protein
VNPFVCVLPFVSGLHLGVAADGGEDVLCPLALTEDAPYPVFSCRMASQNFRVHPCESVLRLGERIVLYPRFAEVRLGGGGRGVLSPQL